MLLYVIYLQHHILKQHKISSIKYSAYTLCAWFQKITLPTHTHPKEGWKWGGGSQNQTFYLKESMNQNWKFQRDGWTEEYHGHFVKAKHYSRLVSSSKCSHLILLTAWFCFSCHWAQQQTATKRKSQWFLHKLEDKM